MIFFQDIHLTKTENLQVRGGVGGEQLLHQRASTELKPLLSHRATD